MSENEWAWMALLLSGAITLAGWLEWRRRAARRDVGLLLGAGAALGGLGLVLQL